MGTLKAWARALAGLAEPGRDPAAAPLAELALVDVVRRDVTHVAIRTTNEPGEHHEKMLRLQELRGANFLLKRSTSEVVDDAVREASARGGEIILIADADTLAEVDYASAVIEVPPVDPLLAPILLSVPAQILAYLTAVEKGTDVDQPRNLAKSVTVE